MNEIQTTENNDIYHFQNGEHVWGAGAHLATEDIIVPQILLMQSGSDWVKSERFKAGDFVHSLDERVLGNKNTPVEIIVFGSYKTIQTFVRKAGTSKDVWESTVPYKPELASPYEQVTPTGDLIKKNTCINFHCILPDDVVNGTVFPTIVSFKKSSFKAGRKLVTMLTKLQLFKKPSSSVVFKLSALMQETDGNKYYVMDVSQGRTATPDELTYSKLMYDLINTANIKVDGEKETE